MRDVRLFRESSSGRWTRRRQRRLPSEGLLPEVIPPSLFLAHDITRGGAIEVLCSSFQELIKFHFWPLRGVLRQKCIQLALYI